MAEAVVYFTVKRLGELLISEAGLLHGVSDQIEEIKRKLEQMQFFLKDVDKKQNRDERLREWVGEIKELAFRTEDVTETCVLEVATKSSFRETLRRCACIPSQTLSHYTMEINVIYDELTNLTSSLQTYGITKGGLEEGETSNSLVNPKSQRIFYSHDVAKNFVGMEKEIEHLICDLTKKDKGWEVVSICGMGGQGKTTLAQKLYNHPQVKAHFKAFAWVCITQQFDMETVFKQILKQLLPSNREIEVLTMEDAQLVKELYKIQLEKNCLIVIDDIWTTNSWRKIKYAFPVGDTTSGSKIILTTRDVKVAEIGTVYNMRMLTEDEGWELLSKQVRINDFPEKRMAYNMEEIGRNIVERCKGLPLAILSVGNLLIGKSLVEWGKISKDISFYLANGQGVTNDDYHLMTQVLGLSYGSLPLHLRHCFLCFANYVEDEEIKTEELYMIWMGEGLILVEDKAEGETMLDVTERYLDELAHRSLVQIEDSPWSKHRTCRVHDLIQDLCLSKVKDEEFINVINLPHGADYKFKPRVRRLCIHSYNDWDESMLKPYDEHVISRIRSLFVRKAARSIAKGVWPDKILSLEKFKLLRVLTVSGYKFTNQNINHISELVYLKCFCLSGCELEELPSSIGNLRTLETLDLRVSNPIKVPNVLWKLKQLKHLYLPEQFKEDGENLKEDARVKKLRFEGLNELELIYNYNTVYCDAHDLIGLSKLKVFDGRIIIEYNLAENIIDFIESRELGRDREGGGRRLMLMLESYRSILEKDNDSTGETSQPTPSLSA